eukprot:gene12491-biopygen9050
MEYLETGVRRDMQQLGREICVNKWWTIAEVRRPTYEDHDYGLICYTDASAAGWGAIVQSPEERWVRTYQQKWIPDFVPGAQAPDHVKRSKHFSAKFCARRATSSTHPPEAAGQGWSPRRNADSGGDGPLPHCPRAEEANRLRRHWKRVLAE